MTGFVVILGGFLLLYSLGLMVLVITGRRNDAVAWARLIPDCLVFVTRLIKDDRVQRRYKVLLAALVAYLAMPFDLVPDFIPVVGLLDDVIIVFLVLRAVVGKVSPEVAFEQWPGNPETLAKFRR